VSIASYHDRVLVVFIILACKKISCAFEKKAGSARNTAMADKLAFEKIPFDFMIELVGDDLVTWLN